MAEAMVFITDGSASGNKSINQIKKISSTGNAKYGEDSYLLIASFLHLARFESVVYIKYTPDSAAHNLRKNLQP